MPQYIESTMQEISLEIESSNELDDRYVGACQTKEGQTSELCNVEGPRKSERTNASNAHEKIIPCRGGVITEGREEIRS